MSAERADDIRNAFLFPQHIQAGGRHASEHDAIAFRVVDPCEVDGVRRDNANEWQGVARPMLTWRATVLA